MTSAKLDDGLTPPAADDFFQQMADGSPVMIWMAGLDMGCFYFNQAWLNFRGRSLEQEAGNGWAEGVHPEDLQRCVSHYIGCFERRIAFAMSYRLLDAAGKYLWILDRGAPHHLPDGTFLGFFGGCADIEQETPIARNAELGPKLAEMRGFAQRVATKEGLTTRVQHTKMPLQTLARNIHEEHQERLLRVKQAADEMEQLATDMLAFGQIPRGACLP